jgi:hypothetical protein
MMLETLGQLLAAMPAAAAHKDYQTAIIEGNALGKGTASTRFWSWKKLRELYGLDPSLAVFPTASNDGWIRVTPCKS